MYYTNGIIVRRCLTNVFSTELARVGGASSTKRSFTYYVITKGEGVSE